MKPKEAPVAPPDTLSGACPRCGPGGVKFLDECHFCHGSGEISYAAVWSAADDSRLRELVSEGGNPNFAALVLHRPIGVVRTRIAELNIATPPPSPEYFIVRRGIRSTDPAVDPAEPVREGW